MSKHKKSAMLTKNCIKFVPYGTKQALPVLEKAKVRTTGELARRERCCGVRNYNNQEKGGPAE